MIKPKINWLAIEDDYYSLDTEEFIEKYQSMPQELYFVIEQDQKRDLRNVWFCPIQFWDKNKHSPDCPLLFLDYLPKHLKNPFDDAFWFSKNSKEDIEKELVALGFVKNDKLINW